MRHIGLRTEGEVLGDEACGDVGAHGFWKRGRTSICGIQICDIDAKSYGSCTSKKILESAARRKKDKYEEACLERRRDFTPMLYSVDSMADKHACAAEKRIAGIHAAKWTRQYSQMASFVRTWMCLAIVRSTTLLLRGDCGMNWRRRAPDDGVAARAAMTIEVVGNGYLRFEPVRCTVSHPTLQQGRAEGDMASIRAAAPMIMAVQFSAVKRVARGYLAASSTIFLLL